MPAKILVEYAKSGRAACKGCGNTIAKGCMRLGIVSKAAGGFDMTRWYHRQCLPSQSEVVSAENINGFPLLKAPDQEALKALVSEFGKQSGPPVTGNEDSQHKPLKSTTEETCGDDQGSPKKLKVEHTSIKSRGHNDVGFLDMLSPSELRSRYKDAILPPKWKAFQTVIFLEQEDGLKASEKIAAFDFDGCLVKTSVRKVGADAWSLHYSTIPEKLQSYYNNGYKLVIFTNESNIDRWKNSRQKAVDSKLGRLEGFINRVKVPMQVFVACGIEGTGDAFRKPKSGMWRLMERHFNSGIVIDMEQSFYVGDAAGRIDDHSDADIGFAKEVGLKFHLPEDFFAPEA